MTLRHNHSDRRLELSLAARDSAVTERARVRALYRCAHTPLCGSLQEHDVLAKFEADAKAKRIAESLAHTKQAERLLRFRIERVDDGVVKQTTASEMFAVWEAVHFVAIGPEGRAACTSPHLNGDTSGCSDAVQHVLSQKINESLACVAPTPE